MATPNKPDTTPVTAKRGKIKGTASVAPKDKPGEGQGEYDTAFAAGAEASRLGHPTRPPLEYSELEVKGWYAGYKSHANPQTGGPVGDIKDGYREDY